jgi:hypothetical protein
MNKKIIFIVLLLVVIAALGCILFFLDKTEKETQALPPPRPEENYLVRMDGVIGVDVINEHGEFTVLSGGDGEDPFIQGFDELSLDTFYLERMLETGGNIISRSVVTDAAEDLVPFGLNPPRVKIASKNNAGETALVHIGNDAPDGRSVYAGIEGSGAVHLVNSGDITNFLKRALDFVELEVTPPGTDDGAGGVVFDTIRLGGLVRKGEDVTIVKEDINTSDTSNRLQMNPYRIQSPRDARLNMDDGVKQIQALFSLRANRAAAIVKDTAELAAYGLSQPYATAEVRGILGKGLGGFTVKVSEPDSAGYVFVQKEDDSIIYEIPASGLPWLGSTWFDLMEKIIVLPMIDDVGSVEIRTPQKAVTFTLSGKEDELVVNAGNTVIETRNFRSYYQTLIIASYNEYTDIPAAALQTPFLEIIYTYREGNSDRVSFYATGSRRVLVSFNGQKPFYTYSVYTDKIIADLDSVLAGTKVMPYL